MSDPLFELHDGAYHPSAQTRGPWDPGLQHGAASAALIGREIERTGPGEEMLVARMTYAERGPASAWFRLRSPVIAGETPTPLQRTVAAADFGNGVSRVLDFDAHLFVNSDLTVHLHREPNGEWVLLDSRTVADPAGAGLSTSALADEREPIGVAAQTLFVDTR